MYVVAETNYNTNWRMQLLLERLISAMPAIFVCQMIGAQLSKQDSYPSVWKRSSSSVSAKKTHPQLHRVPRECFLNA